MVLKNITLQKDIPIARSDSDRSLQVSWAAASMSTRTQNRPQHHMHGWLK